MYFNLTCTIRANTSMIAADIRGKQISNKEILSSFQSDLAEIALYL